ncbi:BgTH12-05140 [Blumeria graminis f. sp. triticale]|uniref:BgtASP-20465 n=3 Tax=Blumeria graminis TaxID=34373 RepID=A0A9X9QCW0_BLUGR|nr:hypothetical protein BGT96224_ASP20465 [Blumeria graminis f. sp. tritici 96224]CAD6502549.1 BgTH12-05140 [Blumeria graminis f. sp. triticale]VDB87948.1 BgtASP-20465 [Blumeria graminis f. sp. tritici]
MYFSKVATILQGASLFVAASASSTTAHISSGSKRFDCLGRIFTLSDYIEEKWEAVNFIISKKLIGRSSHEMEQEYLNDGQTNKIIYSDQGTTMYYLYQLRRLWYTEEDDNFNHNVMHHLLIDNLYRVSGIMLKESWTTREGSRVAGSGARGPKKSFCTIIG